MTKNRPLQLWQKWLSSANSEKRKFWGEALLRAFCYVLFSHFYLNLSVQLTGHFTHKSLLNHAQNNRKYFFSSKCLPGKPPVSPTSDSLPSQPEPSRRVSTLKLSVSHCPNSSIWFKHHKILLFWHLFQAKRAGGVGQNVIARQWANGKPSGDFILGNKIMEG